MRRIFLVALFFASCAIAQPLQQTHPNPDCQFFFTLTATGQHAPGGTPAAYDNRQNGCATWSMSYTNSGFSPVSVELQSAANVAGVPGAFSTGFPVQQTVISGTNPGTSTTAGFVWLNGSNAWVRVLLTATGAGTVSGSVYGWRIPNAGAQGGGAPTGPCGGDLGGTEPNCTVLNLSHVTNSSLANSGLVNPATTVNGQTCTLGSTCTVSTAPSGAAGGDLGSNYPSPTVVNLSNVSNSSLANSGLVNPATTVNGQTCTLGGACSIPAPTVQPVYTATVSAQTTVTVTAATHNQGTLATATCFDGSTPRNVVSCQWSRNTSGDIVFTWNPAFTGLVQIGSLGGGATSNVRSFGGSFDGGGVAMVAGKTTYVTVPFACTISAWNILVDTGTATIDIWRIATGTAIPTVANTITAAAIPAISSNTAIHSTVTTGWCGTGTCTVAANDIFGINLKVVSGTTFANMVVECDQ